MNSWVLRRVQFIGSITAPGSGHGGETIKNRLLLEYIDGRFREVVQIDTVAAMRNPLRFGLGLLRAFLGRNDDLVVLSAATRSACRLIRILGLLDVHGKQVLYLVIGGTLVERVRDRFISLDALRRVDAIYIESKVLCDALTGMGLGHVRHLTNFKRTRGFDPMWGAHSATLRLVFVSRVIPEKGIEILAGVVARMVREGMAVTLDIFGPAEPVCLESVIRLAGETERIYYGGILDLVGDGRADAYQMLAGYDYMVLPTFHYGEGFPAALIDAFIAGLPVITTRWNSNAECVQHGVNGFLVEPKSADDLYRCLTGEARDNPRHAEMRCRAREAAALYDIDYVLGPVFYGLDAAEVGA